MEKYARLIHQAQITFLPTSFPVKYFGMPNGKVYILFARLKKKEPRFSRMEYVLAEHLDFDYNYQTDTLIPKNGLKCHKKVYNEMVDNPDPKTKILKIYSRVTSFTDAYAKLNKIAHTQMNECRTPIKIDSTKKKRNHLSIAWLVFNMLISAERWNSVFIQKSLI